MPIDDAHITLAHAQVCGECCDHAVVCRTIDGPLAHEDGEEPVRAGLNQGTLAAAGLHVDAITGHTETVAALRIVSVRQDREAMKNAAMGKVQIHGELTCTSIALPP